MLRYCRHHDEHAMDSIIGSGNLRGIAKGSTDLVDNIIINMCDSGIIDLLDERFDKRAQNTAVSFELLLASSIAAKMKIHTSLTDIPYAIQDPRTLGKLLCNATAKKDGLLTEGTIRNFIKKYDADDFFGFYNDTVQKIMKHKGLNPNIFMLDCTKIEVNLDNNNYENSTVGRDKDFKVARGYKLATIRGIVGNTGIITDIEFGTIAQHDLPLSKDMVMNSKSFKEEDILIYDRGFSERGLIDYMKSERKVDIYTPLKKNMLAYKDTVPIAKEYNNWEPHPTRKGQKIQFVENIGARWSPSSNNVQLNGCVIWIEETDEYMVIVTTDLKASAKQIIKIYELRPQIEEDYRQLKDFWKIEDFKSTKYNTIAYHIMCVLFGYLFYQLYTISDEGKEYAGKILTTTANKAKVSLLDCYILYTDFIFYCIMSQTEFMEFYANSDEGLRLLIKEKMDMMS